MTGGELALQKFSLQRHIGPPLVLIAVVLVDVFGGRDFVVLGLTVISPMLAAALLSPRLTAMYGVLALITSALLGIFDEQYVGGQVGRAQVVRLIGVAAGGLIGVVAASDRARRENQLAQVTRVAEVAQLAILAPVPTRIEPLRCAVRYVSAAQEATVGGDVYAAVPSPWGARLLVADVRGKGLDAVRLASLVIGAFRERADERDEASMLLDDLDRAVRRAATNNAESEDFVTAVVAQVSESGTLTVVNAGHPPPLLVRAGVGTLLLPQVSRPPLGLDGNARRDVHQLLPRDRLLLYTDGLVEARRAGGQEFFDLEAFAPPTLGSGTLAEGLDALQNALSTWTGGHLADDVALLAVEF